MVDAVDGRKGRSMRVGVRLQCTDLRKGESALRLAIAAVVGCVGESQKAHRLLEWGLLEE